ncbi:unnamed protein product [Cercospora beticola]|nr:unnamed protein product [Cercospora beticola]
MMSSFGGISRFLDVPDSKKLQGKRDFKQWKRKTQNDFQAVNLWRFLTGEERLLPFPDPDAYQLDRKNADPPSQDPAVEFQMFVEEDATDVDEEEDPLALPPSTVGRRKKKTKKTIKKKKSELTPEELEAYEESLRRESRRGSRATLGPEQIGRLRTEGVQLEEDLQGLSFSDRLSVFRFEWDQASKSADREQTAMAGLVARVNNTLIRRIQAFDDPYSAMKWLESQYSQTQVRETEKAFDHFEKIHYRKFNSIQEYLNELESARQDIDDVGGKMTDGIMLSKVIRGLLGVPAFKGFIEHYHSFRDLDPSLDNYDTLTARLLTWEDDQRTAREYERDTREKDTRRVKPERRDINTKKADKKPNVTCHECGKVGHYARDCRSTNKESVAKTTSKFVQTKKTTGKFPPKKFSAMTTVDIEPELDIRTKRVIQGRARHARPDQGQGRRSEQTDNRVMEKGVSCFICRSSDSSCFNSSCTVHAAAICCSITQDIPKSLDRNTWIVDTGANMHFVNDKKWFADFSDFTEEAGTANGTGNMKIQGGGSVKLPFLTSDGFFELNLSSVAYVPTLRCNILSTSLLSCMNEEIVGQWDKDSIRICTSDGLEVARARQTNGLYELALHPQVSLYKPTGQVDDSKAAPLESMPPGVRPPYVAATIDFSDPVWKWHRRMGHLGLDNMRRLLKVSNGISITDKQLKAKLGAICPVCATTRAIVKVPREPATRRFKKPGELLHIDTWGPYPIAGYDGTKYLLLITDDSTRFTWSTRLGNKAEIPQKVRKLLKRIEKSLRIKVRRVRFDNEFSRNGLIDAWMSKHSITIEPTVAASLGYFVGNESESVYLYWDPNSKKVRRTASANVDDDNGPDDLHEGDGINARQERPQRENEADSESEGSDSTDSDSDPDEDDNAALHGDGSEGEPEERESDSESSDLSEEEEPEANDVPTETQNRQEVNEQGRQEEDTQGNQTVRNRPGSSSPLFVLDDDDDDYEFNQNYQRDDYDENGVPRHRPEGALYEADNFLDDIQQAADAVFEGINESQTTGDDPPVRSRFFANMVKRKKGSKTVDDSESNAHLTNEDSTGNTDHPGFDQVNLSEKGRTRRTCLKPKKRRKEGKPGLKADPDKCDRCFKQRLACSGGRPCTNCQDAEAACVDQTSMSQLLIAPENIGITSKAVTIHNDSRCHRCKVKGWKCTGVGCERCEADQETCLPYNATIAAGYDSKEELARKDSVRCHYCTKDKRPCDGQDPFESPCTRCYKSKKKCAPYGTLSRISSVAKDKKCTRCLRKRLSCDGSQPCNQCNTLKQPWLSCQGQGQIPELEDSDCRHCISQNLKCDRRMPCYSCAKTPDHGKARACIYWMDHEGNTKRKYLLPEQLEDFYPNEKECTSCAGKRSGRPCDGGTPCGNCLDKVKKGLDKMTPNGHSHCSYKSGENLIRKYRLQAAPEAFELKESKDVSRIPGADRNIYSEESRQETREKLMNLNFPDSDYEAKSNSRQQGKRGSGVHTSNTLMVTDNAPSPPPTDKELDNRKTGELRRVDCLLSARKGWYCHQMDIKTAFLNGEVDEEIYMDPPEGFPERNGHVLKLEKALYGLKQAPRQWYKKLKEYFAELGWQPSEYDSSVFMDPDAQAGSEDGLYATVYVDDINIFGANLEKIKSTKQDLNARFDVSDLGECAYYLGMHVTRDNLGGIGLHQKAFVQKLLAQFGLEDLRPVSTPMDVARKLTVNEGQQADLAFTRRYQSMVGSLNYLMTVARPDITYAVGVVSRYASNPNESHKVAVYRIYAYLKKYPELGPEYSDEPTDDCTLGAEDTVDPDTEHDPDSTEGTSTPTDHLDEIVGYVDSDWAGCHDTRRSTTGFVFIIAGSPIAWASKRQKSVAMSSCEAEYMAAAEAAKEAIWLKNLLQELKIPGFTQDKVTLYIDNNAAIKLSKNPEFHARTKHIELRHHFLREQVQDGAIQIKRVNTKDNLADMFTKALPRATFESILTRLRLISKKDERLQIRG